MSSVNGGPDQLYDLLADPLELVDLLGAGGLTPSAQFWYDALKLRLEQLLAGE